VHIYEATNYYILMYNQVYNIGILIHISYSLKAHGPLTRQGAFDSSIYSLTLLVGKYMSKLSLKVVKNFFLHHLIGIYQLIYESKRRVGVVRRYWMNSTYLVIFNKSMDPVGTQLFTSSILMVNNEL
jgi:hypothetical protein